MVHKKNVTMQNNPFLWLDIHQSKKGTLQLYFVRYATKQTHLKVSILVVPFMSQSEV